MKLFMRHIYALMLVSLLVTSCSCNNDMQDGNVLVKVGKSLLTTNDLARQMPYGLSAEDSTKFARAYIRNWIDTKLVSEIAYKNISDTKEIDRMVDEYRNELIMWEYRKRMYAQNATEDFSDDAITAYYEAHKEDFISKQPFVKGLYIKIENNAPKINDLRKWYRSTKTEDIDKIEKYGLNGAIHYDYFRDKWIDWEQIASKIPYDFGNNPDVFLKTNHFLDSSIGGFTYLLDISEYIPTGSIMPIDVAMPLIKEMMVNEHRLQYDSNLRKQLYNKAVEDNDVTIYCDMGS